MIHSEKFAHHILYLIRLHNNGGAKKDEKIQKNHLDDNGISDVSIYVTYDGTCY